MDHLTFGTRTPRDWTLHTTYELTWVYEGVLFEALADIVYIRERISFSLMWTYKKAITNYEVKVDVQKGVLRFKEKVDSGCVSFL